MMRSKTHNRRHKSHDAIRHRVWRFGTRYHTTYTDAAGPIARDEPNNGQSSVPPLSPRHPSLGFGTRYKSLRTGQEKGLRKRTAHGSISYCDVVRWKPSSTTAMVATAATTSRIIII